MEWSFRTCVEVLFDFIREINREDDLIAYLKIIEDESIIDEESDGILAGE